MARPDGREIAAVFAGGAVGTTARAVLADTLPSTPHTWPWATFAVNLVGAFVLGCVTGYLQRRSQAPGYLKPLLGTGFCGGLTTFSTMQVEILKMLRAHAYGLAAQYAAVSVVAGLAVATAGVALAGAATARQVTR